jgi:hypothetical protein
MPIKQGLAVVIGLYLKTTIGSRLMLVLSWPYVENGWMESTGSEIVQILQLFTVLVIVPVSYSKRKEIN